ncbi:uncharacterized protein LOC124155877 [Ischnura elegans]|uniref:uncharacterized protein LOC124155877 n=1 Tax=Ischnura elegans TaxID=197161 RepID=UPI001ED8694A|nr:uncharacterized protein LOC124155877 [Ischnura elegans]
MEKNNCNFSNMLALAVLFSILIAFGSCEIEVLGNAKNVILVIANGMSSMSVASTRIQEAKLLENSSHILTFETFPHHGFLKAYDSKFKPGNGYNPLFFGKYDQSNNALNVGKSLFNSAQKNKKSIGVVTTVEMEKLLSLFNQIGLSNSTEKSQPNCSNPMCHIIHGSFGIDPDIIVGQRSGLPISENTSCDCFHYLEENNTKQSFKAPKRLYVNSIEDFNKVMPNGGVKLFGLLSDDASAVNGTDAKMSMLNIINTVKESIKYFRNNPSGYFMVVILDYDDVIKTVKMTSILADSIIQAISMKDTLLVVTSDITSRQNCKSGIMKEEVLNGGVKSTGMNIVVPTIQFNNTTARANESTPVVPITPINSSKAEEKTQCTEYSISSFVDAPVYAYGPYPSKMPALQDQATFGLKIMKILEEKQYEGIKFDSEIGELNSDMFQKEVKAAMAEIDEMTKELFNDWI